MIRKLCLFSLKHEYNLVEKKCQTYSGIPTMKCKI